MSPFTCRITVLRYGIYVDARLLAKWFPIDIDYDIASLSVKLTSREPLPKELRAARDDRRKKLNKNRERKINPRVEIPYKLFRVPIFDVSMDHTYSNDKEGVVSNNTRTSALAAGDFMGLSSEIYISGDDAQRISQARLEFGKKDPDGKLLGFMKASEYSAGDISVPQVSMVSGVRTGRGVKVSNHAVDSPDEFDRITLEGDLLIGWDVELYRNEVLLDFKSSQSNGRYEFADVPLLFGVNILKLSFYGPQGQVRNEIRQLRIGPGQIKPGQTFYKASVNQQDLQLLLGEEHGTTVSEQSGKTRAGFDVQHGITKNFSVGSNLTTVPSIHGGHDNYLGVSLRGFYNSIAGRFDTVRDLSKGWAHKLSLQTNISDISFLANHARYYDFYSEQISNTSDPLLHQTNLRMDGIARVPLIPHVPYSFNLSRDYHRSKDALLTLDNRLSMAIGAAALTNNLSWILNSTETTSDSNVSGSTALGGSLFDIRLRGQVAYDVRPEAGVSSGTLSGDWQITPDYRAKLSVDKSFETTRLTTIAAGLTTNFKHVAMGGNLEYTDDGDVTARMTMGFSFGQNPNDNSPYMRGRHSASKGGIASRVFLDNNSNGVYDEGDEPLENVALKLDNSRTVETSDEKGLVTSLGISTYRTVNVSVAKKSLEDPFWTPATEGISFVPRPGVVAVVDFPILTSGEIDGTVYRKKGKWASEVSDVILQLLDPKGKVVRETKSSFDGFYLFDFVRPGKYTVRVDPDQLKRLAIPELPGRPVEIKVKGSVTSDLDFILRGERGAKNFRVLLTAFGNLEALKDGWKGLQKVMGNKLRKLRPIIDKAPSSDGTKTLYYLHTGSFASRGAAETLCKLVREKKGNSWCNPIRVQIEAAKMTNPTLEAGKNSTLSGVMMKPSPAEKDDEQAIPLPEKKTVGVTPVSIPDLAPTPDAHPIKKVVIERQEKSQKSQPKKIAKVIASENEALLVQVASARSEIKAKSEWERVVRQAPELFKGRDPFYTLADLGPKGEYHRLSVGPFSNLKERQDFCAAIVLMKIGCLKHRVTW
jgi:hypothetical protein